jgi:hypothetical protein
MNQSIPTKKRDKLIEKVITKAVNYLNAYKKEKTSK